MLQVLARQGLVIRTHAIIVVPSLCSIVVAGHRAIMPQILESREGYLTRGKAPQDYRGKVKAALLGRGRGLPRPFFTLAFQGVGALAVWSHNIRYGLYQDIRYT